MTSRIAVCALLAAACLVFPTGCPSNERPAGPSKLILPAIKDGETAIYEVARGDTVLYRSETRVHLDEELVGSSGGSSAAVPTLELTTTVTTVDAEQFYYDSSVVILLRDGLKPLRSVRYLETDVGRFEIQTQYEQARVRIAKQSIDGTEVKEFRLPANSFDNDMVPFILRGMSLAPSARLSLNIVTPLSMRTLAAEVRVLGTKLVPTRLGEIMCREVELTMQGRRVRLWYELAEPHRLVVLFNPDRQNELRLVEYRPGLTSELP